jgi:hypothetical protein
MRWWFDWNLQVAAVRQPGWRIPGPMDDRYPATDDHQSVRLGYSYPDAPELNRCLPPVKWLLAIPHYIVLFFLALTLVTDQYRPFRLAAWTCPGPANEVGGTVCSPQHRVISPA